MKRGSNKPKKEGNIVKKLMPSVAYKLVTGKSKKQPKSK